jgi:hypothetical protein
VETANISHIDVNIRTKVCNEPNGGISLSYVKHTLSWDNMVEAHNCPPTYHEIFKRQYKGTVQELIRGEGQAKHRQADRHVDT